MKKYIFLTVIAVSLATVVSSCATYDALSHSKCQANRTDNHRYGRGTAQ